MYREDDIRVLRSEPLTPLLELKLIYTQFTNRQSPHQCVIYVAGEQFKQCMFLAVTLDPNSKEAAEIDSIDKLAAVRGARTLEGEKAREHGVSPEEEFWGHLSNLQGWVELDYNPNALHSNLAYPLLKALTDAGDDKARRVLRGEIHDRLAARFYPTTVTLIESALPFMTADDVNLALETKTPSYAYKTRPVAFIMVTKVKYGRLRMGLEREELCDILWHHFTRGKPGPYKIFPYDHEDGFVIELVSYLCEVHAGRDDKVKAFANIIFNKDVATAHYVRLILVNLSADLVRVLGTRWVSNAVALLDYDNLMVVLEADLHGGWIDDLLPNPDKEEKGWIAEYMKNCSTLLDIISKSSVFELTGGAELVNRLFIYLNPLLPSTIGNLYKRFMNTPGYAGCFTRRHDTPNWVFAHMAQNSKSLLNRSNANSKLEERRENGTLSKFGPLTPPEGFK